MKKLNLFQVSLIFFTIILCASAIYLMIAVCNFSADDTDSLIAIVVGSILYSAIFIALAVPLILKNSNKHPQRKFLHQSTHRNIHIYLLFAYLVLALFQLFKVFYYGSHRELYSADYNIIYNGFMYSAFIMFWMLYVHTYNKNGNWRKTTFGYSIVCVLLLCVKVYSSASIFSKLFFATANYTPVFIDQFTSLFELIYIILFTLAFIAYFIYLTVKGYFRKPKPVEELPTATVDDQ